MTARFFWTVAMSLWVLGCSMAKEPAGGGKEAWLTDFEAAKARAAELKRPILADFSGSDWCGWCIRLDREVFQTAIFRNLRRRIWSCLSRIFRKKALNRRA